MKKLITFVFATLLTLLPIVCVNAAATPKPETVSDPLTLEEIAASTGTIDMNSGGGSGFIIDRDGYVATCYHVIADNGLDSTTNSGKFILGYKTDKEISYNIEGVVAYSQTYDIAILKISGSNFIPVPLGDSDNISFDDVYILSSPLDHGETVVKTNIAKDVVNSYGMREIQTSSSPTTTNGSSGGAVIKESEEAGKYEVIGMYAAEYTDNDLGVAIPINLLPRDYKNNKVLPLSEVNNARDYRINETYKKENGEEKRDSLSMGERYDRTLSSIQDAIILSKPSDGSTWFYDKFYINEDGDNVVKDLAIRSFNNGNYRILDYAATIAPYYRIGRNATAENPFYYFSPANNDGYFYGYGTDLEDDGDISIWHRTYLDEEKKGIKDGEGIILSNYGERVHFRRYLNDKSEGFAAEFSGSHIFFYERKNGLIEGNCIRFGIQNAEFSVVNYIANEVQGDYVPIKEENIPALLYAERNGDSGELAYSYESQGKEQIFTLKWNGNGNNFEMESPTQYAEKKGEIIKAWLKSDDNFNPYIMIAITNKHIIFDASETEFTGYFNRKNGHMELVNASEPESKRAIIADNIWYLGKINGSIGSGAIYNVRSESLYIGEFILGEDMGYTIKGQGTWVIPASENILSGKWDENKLISSEWD